MWITCRKREGHWAIVQGLPNEWTQAARIDAGKLFGV
jgi:hypothetical protein